MSTVALLAAYCAQAGTAPALYQSALDIFVDLNETLAQGPAQAPSNLDNLVIGAIQQASSVFTRYRQQYRIERSLRRAANTLSSQTQQTSSAPPPSHVARL
ncbi:hypothetical protein BGZ67_009654 [Mortierella alpina]|nr:hypothetical protein BGZ67_009654 [Mortierella alpina]